MTGAGTVERTDTLVIGGGQAGLSTSYWLSKAGVDHLVVDGRDQLGGSWHDRWDSFCLVLPNFTLQQPGMPYDGDDPDGFMGRDDVVKYLQTYGAAVDPQVRLGAAVRRLAAEDSGFVAHTDAGTFRARNVVLATGPYPRPRVPELAASLPGPVRHLHSRDYRRPEELPAGAVLVVGTGQSGAQIAEELNRAGRDVHLAVSKVPAAPRRYRGRDFGWWLMQIYQNGPSLGIFPKPESPAARFAGHPMLSGQGGGHAIDLAQFARDGVHLHGRLESVDGTTLRFSDDLAERLEFARNQFDRKQRRMFDAYGAAAGIEMPPDDRAAPDDSPVPDAGPELDLAAAGIGSVVWATGYELDFGWVDLPIFDEWGYPHHSRGVTVHPGLYAVGLPWLASMASAVSAGAGVDAEHIVEHIVGRNRSLSAPAERAVPALARDVRPDFPILATDLDGKPPVYLDNGATTQIPRQVLDTMFGYYAHDNSNVGRGVHTLGMRATERFSLSRDRVRAFLNAGDASEIVFTKSATESLNMVAQGFGSQVVSAGDEVLISGLEHHSNLLPWRQLCAQAGATLRVAAVDEHGELTVDAFRAQLTDRTRLIAVAHVSNVQGTVNPVREIAAEAHRHGIPVVVDGAQAVAHRRVDVVDLGVDFYCFSAHKMYGPHGIGVLYGKAEHLDRMQPVLLGGGMTPIATYEDGPIGDRPPLRFEAGSPNIAGVVGLAAAMDYLDDLDRDVVGEHDAALTERAAAGLRGLDGVRVFGAQAPRGGIVSFTVDGVHPHDVGAHLNTFGIATRTGVHCAAPFVRGLGIVGSVRVSFAVYNTEAEVDLLISSVATARPGFWTREHPDELFVLPG